MRFFRRDRRSNLERLCVGSSRNLDRGPLRAAFCLNAGALLFTGWDEGPLAERLLNEGGPFVGGDFVENCGGTDCDGFAGGLFGENCGGTDFDGCAGGENAGGVDFDDCVVGENAGGIDVDGCAGEENAGGIDFDGCVGGLLKVGGVEAPEFFISGGPGLVGWGGGL